VTDASVISEQLALRESIKNSVASDEIILRALAETRVSTSAILRKLEEIRAGTSQIHSALDSSLMVPQTPSSVGTVVKPLAILVEILKL
jgi:hypothetical protein